LEEDTLSPKISAVLAVALLVGTAHANVFINSIANGVSSTDVGVAQTSSTLVGPSFQRIGFGSTWVATDGSNTKGFTNVPEPATPVLVGLGCVVLLRRRPGCRRG
jgi:hypothetical protein